MSPKKKGSRNWIMLSVVCSAVAILWAFTIPFRLSGKPAVSVEAIENNLQQLRLAKDISVGGGSAEEIRNAARQIDRELMKMKARRDSKMLQSVPTSEEIRIIWQDRVNRARRDTERYRQAAEGSVKWAYRRERIQALSDGPR